MIKRLPFNDFDMAGITNIVTRYKAHGLRADYSITQKSEGVVRIVFENPMTRDGSIVVFDVHKIAKPGWFGTQAHWIIQLSSKQPTQEPQLRGCVSGKTQAHALHAAEIDLKHGFLSIADFSVAANAH